MMKLRKILKSIYLKISDTKVLHIIPDRIFISVIYKLATGQKLNLKSPKTFNEKLQWMKLYDHNPMYIHIVDKYAVRAFVEERVGQKYLIPLFGKWDSCAEIDFDSLPEQFVLKCNHDSGGIVICKDKSKFDKCEAVKFLNTHQKKNHYYLSREWAYKYVKPCIIAEQYMIDKESQDLRDYKFFCFNGVPKLVQVDFARFVNHKRNLYTTDWTLLDLTIKCPNDPDTEIPKPQNYDDMLEVAKKLSVGFPEVRVDLYSVNGKTYFGEMTLYHGSGIEKFAPEDFGTTIGSWINLSLAYKEKDK